MAMQPNLLDQKTVCAWMTAHPEIISHVCADRTKEDRYASLTVAFRSREKARVTVSYQEI